MAGLPRRIASRFETVQQPHTISTRNAEQRRLTDYLSQGGRGIQDLLSVLRGFSQRTLR